MATYGSRHQIFIVDEIELMRDQIKRDMFDGNEEPTLIIMHPSGLVDPFTEEITYAGEPVQVPISGIVGTVMEGDALLGAGGRVKLGDAKVTYHYSNISGMLLQQDITEVTLVTPAISGAFQVSMINVETLANEPMFVQVALAGDQNG